MEKRLEYPFGEVEQRWRQTFQRAAAPQDRETKLEPRLGPSSSGSTRCVYSWPPGVLGPRGDLSVAREWLSADTYARFALSRGQAVESPRVVDSASSDLAVEARTLGQSIGRRVEAQAAHARSLVAALGLRPESPFVETGDPAYYRFTQWIFLQLHLRGLVKRVKTRWDVCSRCGKKHRFGAAPVCTACQGELVPAEAFEWRADFAPFGEKLLQDLERSGFTPGQIAEQRSALGRVRGCEVTFPASRIFEDEYVEITAFTTSIEQIYGVTFILLDPYHPLLEQLMDPTYEDDVLRYRERLRKGAEPHISATRTGGFALNPANLRRIPILVSALARTPAAGGVILAVPAHDKDLFELARRLKLPIREVIHSDKAKFDSHSRLEEPWLGDGVLTNSGSFTSLTSKVGRERILTLLSRKEVCQRATRFRLSWLPLSTSSPHGPPVPMVHCKRCGTVPVPEGQLPVELPEEILKGVVPAPQGSPPRPDEARAVRDTQPTIESLKNFVRAPCPICGETAARDTQTIHPWLGAAWSYLRGVLPELAGKVEGFRDPSDASAAPPPPPIDAPESATAPGEESLEAAGQREESSESSAGGDDRLDMPEDLDVFDLEDGAGEDDYADDGEAGDEGDDGDSPQDAGEPAMEDDDGGEMDDSLTEAEEVIEPVASTQDSEAGPPRKERAQNRPEPAARGSQPESRRNDEPEDLKELSEEDAPEESPLERLSRLRPFAPLAASAILPIEIALGRSSLRADDILAVRYLAKFLEEAGHLRATEPFARLKLVGAVRLSPSARPGKARANGGALDLVERFGADALRMALLFSGPLHRQVELSEDAVYAAGRFLNRIWTQLNLRREKGRFVSRKMLEAKHFLIHEVTQRLSQWKSHTAVAALMRFVAFLEDPETAPEDMDRGAMRTFLVLLAPFAPFLARELWSRLGETQPIETASWPTASDELIHPPEREFPIYLGGKVCDRMVQPSNLESEKLESRALSRPKILELIGTRRVERVVVVPGRLVSLILAP